MTVTTPTIWYANYGNGSSTGYFAVGTWVANVSKTVGQFIRATAPAVGSERIFVCIVAGTTSNPTQPTWVTTKGAKTTDTGVTWMECSGNPALNGDLGSTPLSSQNRSGAQVLGNIITNNTQDHYFICTSAGSTGAGEPTFTTTTGGTTVDSGCTWTCLGTVGTFSTAWGAPIARVGNSSIVVPAAGTLYLSTAHAETQSANLTISLGGATNNAPINMICIANAPSFPPVAADISTGASVTTTANATLTLNGCHTYNGVTLSCGSGANAPVFTIGSNASPSFIRISNGNLTTPTSLSSSILFDATVELYNTTVTFGSGSGQVLQFSGSLLWRDTPSALAATTWPTNLFSPASGTAPNPVLLEGVDLSGFAGTNLFSSGSLVGGRSVLSHCKLPSSYQVVSTPNSFSFLNGGNVDLINCDSGGATYTTERHGFNVSQTTATNVIATGGASDGTTSYSWELASTTGLSWTSYFECIPIVIWNTTITPSNPTVTLQGAYVGTALPFNDDIWFDCRYFGTSSSTLSTRKTNTKATSLSSNTQWSASATLWGSAAAARQNSHAYVSGDAIGVSSGGSIVRAFVCTTAGTSNGSLPGAYGSAVDGSQISDGTAVFTAVERFAMTLALTTPQPQAAGYLLVYVRVAKISSTFYIDPSVTLT